jgi:hypothetical protein
MMRSLVVHRGSISERGVTPMRVVPAFQPFEDRHLGFGLRAEVALIKQLPFQCGEEAFSADVFRRINTLSPRQQAWRYYECFC